MSIDQHNDTRPPAAAPEPRASRKRSDHGSNPLITLFSIPKPFKGHNGVIQRNAIGSWQQLTPAVSVILVGNEAGVAETASEMGTAHVAAIERNEHGTPVVSSAFEAARQQSSSPILCYCNCDVILLPDFVQAISELHREESLDSFVAIGRRTELDLATEIDFESREFESDLRSELKSSGRSAAIVCKEYFAFTRDQYHSMPRFAVGRGNWDNWMVASAKRAGVPVVDVSRRVTAIHQNHDYGHAKSTRMECYVTGDEAKRNQELAGGRNIISGATATWRLTDDGLSRKPFAWTNVDFWLDLHRFSGLLLDLARPGRK